jgi:hypothetical protein
VLGARELAEALKVETIIQRVHSLHESNPMIGHRGCRLGIAYPEITEMQACAIFEDAADVAKKKIRGQPSYASRGATTRLPSTSTLLLTVRGLLLTPRWHWPRGIPES